MGKANELTSIERDAEIRKRTRAYIKAVIVAHPELVEIAKEFDERVRLKRSA